MSVEQTDVVDLVGIETATGKVILTISDHLDWQDERSHLSALQSKVNTYIAFVESGELVEAYPDAKGKDVVISLVSKYPLSEDGVQFIKNAKAALSATGIEVRSTVLSDD